MKYLGFGSFVVFSFKTIEREIEPKSNRRQRESKKIVAKN